ncbi:MAG: ATP synthase F1 subunit epsilon [Eubacteriales bacterium]|nr:ATP synthase F1 subunit epsilon [Eubacteriales bacterium]
MADSKTIKLLINTPERVFYNDDVTMVELATSEGEIGVYPDHIPLTAVLVPCVLKIHQDGEVKKAAVHGGIVEILKDKVTVLAEIAEWPDEIDVNRANEAKTRAERRLSSKDSNLDVARAELALKRSLARLGAAD